MVHLCKEICFLNSVSNNCGGKCILSYPHEGNKHSCGNVHYCNKKCSLENISCNCKLKCCLEYCHKNECLCILPKEKHICNKKCNIREDCKENCILIAGHEGKCLCGKCNCPESCKYKDCSRNCNKKCQYLAGHQGNEHVCEISKHYCKFECNFKDNSINCNKFCYLEVNHSEDNHICNILKNEHICNKKCYLNENSRNCNKDCSLKVNHEGKHLCNIPLNNHLCRYKCDLYEKSRKCNQVCNKTVNHLDNHICSLDIFKHFCKNQCSLFNKSREGCKEKCCFQAGHKGDCFCENSKISHKCKKFCCFYDNANGCKKFCNLPFNHEGNHNCEIPPEEHKCKGYCYLNGKTRGNCFNDSKCCLPYGHKEECICSKNHQHLCINECQLFKLVKKGCNRLCNLIHGHDGKHLCGENHLCPKNCYYFNKSKGNCNHYCNLPYEHEGKCICKEPHKHLCNKECIYYQKSGGCNKDCSLIYEHNGECICALNKNCHTCTEKCQLCDTVCGHVYNHENMRLPCNKCNSIYKFRRTNKYNNFCKLSKKGHLCGAQHKCSEDCQANGWCYIESYIKPEEQTYKSRSGEEIKYYAIKYQEIHKNKCKPEIPINEFSHKEKKHTCGSLIHKCGVKCPQCEYCCTEIYGHFGLHYSLHGNIKNSYFSVSNDIALVKKEKKNYKFVEGETAKIFFCDKYCRE